MLAVEANDYLLCCALVRLYLEENFQLGAPWYKRNTDTLERVQWRTIRMVGAPSTSCRLKEMGLLSVKAKARPGGCLQLLLLSGL